MPRFRKLPVEIEAVQFTGDNVEEIAEFSGYESDELTSEYHQYLVIETREGDMTASIGDWIIKGVKGELYPCGPDIFEMTYEPLYD